MSLRTTLRLSRESSFEEGTPDEVMDKRRRAVAEQVRPARLEVARRIPKWTEIQDDLVPRGRGTFVSAESDAVYTPARGAIFQPYSVNVIADQTELFFTVVDGELTFYERRPFTWSEHVARRERRRVERERA